MRRVEYDINQSNYFCRVNNYLFYFSSIFNQRRFEANFNIFIQEETSKLIAKYHMNINLYDYLLLVFYKKIEKRGFKVKIYMNNDIIDLKEDYTFKIS